MFRLGYNTNGLAHHRLLDAMRLIAELGYEGLAITPDVGQLDPYSLRPGDVQEVRQWSNQLGLELCVETGARFLLDAQRKHHPNLLDPESEQRARRVDFYKRCVDMAAGLGSRVVSLWAGGAPGDVVFETAARDTALPLLDRLAEGLEEVLKHAVDAGVQLAFEPEPGMFIERPQGYAALVEHLGAAGDTLGLTLDVGHCLVTGDMPVPVTIAEYAPRIVNVHLDDIADGVHEHRMFGTGDLDLPSTLAALIEAGFDGMASVELSRDAHRGAAAAAEAYQHLRAALQSSP